MRPHSLPTRLFKALSGVIEWGVAEKLDRFADRCGGSAGTRDPVCPGARLFPCFPLNCAAVNQRASTNGGGFYGQTQARQPPTYNCATMENLDLFDQLTQRVERLLQQHAELQESNILLSVQVEELTQERDALLSRLGNARERLEALLERLPAPPNENADAAPAQTSASLS